MMWPTTKAPGLKARCICLIFRSAKALRSLRKKGGWWLLRSFLRAARVVVCLHSPQPEDAIEHSEHHDDYQEAGAPPLHGVIAVPVEDIADCDQKENDGVDDPVHGLRHDVVQCAEAGQLIEEEWEDRCHWQQFGRS